jgi:FAD dependent oxidoreductase TIGR03364
VTVTGQRQGRTWQRARFSRDVWDRVAPLAHIPVLQQGLTITARRPAALALLEAFAATEMGADCRLLGATEAARHLPMAGPATLAALVSPHERRIEARTAIARLAAWLEASHGVRILRGAAVARVEPGRIDSSAGRLSATKIVVCPGPDLVTLFPQRLAAHRLTLCKLQMLRLAPPGWQLPQAVMSDLSLVRYDGYAALPESVALRQQLQAEAGDALAHGVHLIIVQSADGSLVVGDSHHYAATPDPFAAAEVERIILREAGQILDLPSGLAVLERWIGVYPSSPDHTAILEWVAPDVALCLVSSGTGMSTAFALGEEGIALSLGEPDPLAPS